MLQCERRVHNRFVHDSKMWLEVRERKQLYHGEKNKDNSVSFKGLFLRDCFKKLRTKGHHCFNCTGIVPKEVAFPEVILGVPIQATILVFEYL